MRISDFGQHGPLRDRAATPLTVQAASGWVNTRDPDRPPVQAGARIAEYVAGGYGALGALTALRAAARNATVSVEVDVSVLESLLSTLPYPMLMAEKMRSLGLPANTEPAPMLGIVRAADGWIGINCLTGQHWLDVCAMLGLPEYGEHQIAIMLGGPERAEFFEKAQPWLAERTVAEIVELEPGDADSGRPGQRRRHRPGLPAIRRARVLRRRRRRRLVVPPAGRAVPAVEDPGAAASRRRAAMRPAAKRCERRSARRSRSRTGSAVRRAESS